MTTDSIKQIGKYLKQSQDKSTKALSRYQPTTSVSERVRDIFDNAHTFKMKFKSQSSGRVKLDLRFYTVNDLGTKSTCSDCFCYVTEAFLGGDTTYDLTYTPVTSSSIKVYKDTTKVTVYSWDSDKTITITETTSGYLVYISYVYSYGDCTGSDCTYLIDNFERLLSDCTSADLLATFNGNYALDPDYPAGYYQNNVDFGQTDSGADITARGITNTGDPYQGTSDARIEEGILKLISYKTTEPDAFLNDSEVFIKNFQITDDAKIQFRIKLTLDQPCVNTYDTPYAGIYISDASTGYPSIQAVFETNAPDASVFLECFSNSHNFFYDSIAQDISNTGWYTVKIEVDNTAHKAYMKYWADGYSEPDWNFTLDLGTHVITFDSNNVTVDIWTNNADGGGSTLEMDIDTIQIGCESYLGTSFSGLEWTGTPAGAYGTSYEITDGIGIIYDDTSVAGTPIAETIFVDPLPVEFPVTLWYKVRFSHDFNDLSTASSTDNGVIIALEQNTVPFADIYKAILGWDVSGGIATPYLTLNYRSPTTGSTTETKISIPQIYKNIWYDLKLYVNPGGKMYGKYWASSDVEPTSWTGESSFTTVNDTTVLNSQWCSYSMLLYGAALTELEIDYIYLLCNEVI